MRLFIIIAICVPQILTFQLSRSEVQAQWKQFKELHQKLYHWEEERERFEVFKYNLKQIQKHNALYEKHLVSFKMGINHFGDLTTEEFIQKIRNHNANTTFIKSQHLKKSSVPDAIDWREKGAVTDVKNQGICGSSWIFSVTGALESQNFLQTGQLIPLSEQELADCATPEGCSGGTPEDAYKYVMEHGLSAAADYPGTNDGSCHRGSIPSAVTANGYVSVVANEEGLKDLVGTIGPIAVDIDASSWQFYSEGILHCRNSKSVNHGVLVVGYGNDGGSDFWLVKNSWGPQWGESGYGRVARGGGGSCGITSAPSYPIVQG